MDLQSYIEILEREGELHRIKAEVSSEYEITEIALRGVKEGGPALLFENVKGSDFPLIINQNSTKKRLKLGLGEEPAEGAAIVKLLSVGQEAENVGIVRFSARKNTSLGTDYVLAVVKNFGMSWARRTVSNRWPT